MIILIIIVIYVLKVNFLLIFLINVKIVNQLKGYKIVQEETWHLLNMVIGGLLKYKKQFHTAKIIHNFVIPFKTNNKEIEVF